MGVLYVLLAVSILLAVCKSSLYNAYAKQSEPTLGGIFGFNAVSYGVAALIALCLFLTGARTVSTATVLCSLGYAVIVFSLQTLSVSAMKVGAMSLTSICVMYGMILPALAGPIFWHEPFGVRQAFGIVLMMLSLWLLKGERSDERQRISGRWIALAALCFVFSGMAGVMEKIHQSTDGRQEKAGFVLIACVFMFLFSVCLRLFFGRIRTECATAAMPKRGIVIGALSGLIIGAYSIVNLTLAGGLDSIVYYPVANGGALLLTVLVSSVVFRETFGKTRIAGVVIGLGGMILLSIPN